MGAGMPTEGSEAIWGGGGGGGDGEHDGGLTTDVTEGARSILMTSGWYTGR